MPGDLNSWGTEEWEKHFQRLLKRRYLVPGTYQHSPAETHGDCGLEGYASDGTGYQCYSAQGWSDPKTLYEKQRDRITKDIATFLAKEAELVAILGSVKIKTWNLAVPYWANKDLIKHAKVKEKLVDQLSPSTRTTTFALRSLQLRISLLKAKSLPMQELVALMWPHKKCQTAP